MALIYNGFEILTTGHVDFSSHDLDRVIWDDPVVGEQVVWERQHATWSGLKFVSTGTSTLKWIVDGTSGSIQRTIEYSTNYGTTWNSLYSQSESRATEVTFAEIWIRGNNTTYGIMSGWNQFMFGGDNVYASGNIMSLIDSTDFESLTSLTSTYTFHRLFYNQTRLISAPDLPATTLKANCYYGMFSGCTSLTTAPELPAQYTRDYCYAYMFNGCTALTYAPSLPAISASTWCCMYMFAGCTSLTTAPDLPATTLYPGCYAYMFKDCTSLITPPLLTDTFMPEHCYYGMFEGCTSLTTSPILLSTPNDYSYKEMFKGCTNLTKVTCYATYVSSTDCTKDWLSGASSTGDFFGYCSTPWTRDDSGIPVGWNWHCLEQQYTLIFGTMGNGSVTATVNGVSVTSPAQVTEGSTVILTATPDYRHHFTQWSDGTSTNPYQFTMNSDVELYGSFEQDAQYTLTFLAINGSVDVPSFTGYPGDTVTVTVTPSYRHQFVRWNDRNTENPRTFTVGTSSVTYTATSSLWEGLVLTNISSSPNDYIITFDGGSQVHGETIWFSLDLGATWITRHHSPQVPLTFNAGQNKVVYIAREWGVQTLVPQPIQIHIGLDTEVSGNINSLLQVQTYRDITEYPETWADIFVRTFAGNTHLIHARDLQLPATTLASGCYGSMFFGCTGLTSAPSLPATTLASYCYANMFYNCTSLTSAPDLPVTTLASYCYQYMFGGCTSLVSAPILPATTLKANCYDSMFYGCTSLTGPVNISATSPYSGLGSACTSMFTNTGTSRPSTPTDYNKIKVGGNVSLWNSENCGIDSTYWTVELLPSDVDDQESNE